MRLPIPSQTLITVRDFLDPKEYMTDEEYKEYLKRTQDEQPQDTARTSSDDDWKDMPF